MSTKVTELDNRRDGDRGACPICAPRADRVSESQLWTWAMAQAEIARHHEDFARISELVRMAIERRMAPWYALGEIRKIVG